LVNQPDYGPPVKVDITKATHELGFKPKIELAEGIRDYVRALLER
jgi:nucleoside-diphosphate-sugar epimerase